MSFHKSTMFPWFPWFFVLSVATMSPLLAQVSRPSANLLPNPSFEEKTAGGVAGWKSRAWRGKENARWSVESPGRTGKRCLSIGSEKGADAAWTTTVTVTPNTFYRLSGWIKTQDVRGAVGALLNIQNMQHVRTDAVSGTRDWTRVSTVFQSEAVTELEINCLFGGWGTSTGRAWYDDVALEQIECSARRYAGDCDDRYRRSLRALQPTDLRRLHRAL